MFAFHSVAYRLSFNQCLVEGNLCLRLCITGGGGGGGWPTVFWGGNLRVGDNLDDVGIGGWVILKWILKA